MLLPMLIALAALYLGALSVACGGLLPKTATPRADYAVHVTPTGRHAKRWPPVAEMLDTRELAMLYDRPYPDTWVRQ